MNKSVIFFAIAALFLSTGCSRNSKVLSTLEEQVNSVYSRHYVLAIQTGKDITISTTPDKHLSRRPSAGTAIGEATRLTNFTRFGYCRGCDSCMRSYADAGLIKYSVKERSENYVIADVELTSKGKKYLLTQLDGTKACIDSEAEAEVKRLKDSGIELVVLDYDYLKKARVVQQISDDIYYCEAVVETTPTPFLNAVSGMAFEIESDTLRYSVTRYRDEYGGNGEDMYVTKMSEGYVFDFAESDGYRLDEYKSMENILKEHFLLSDTIATYHMLSLRGDKVLANKKEINVVEDVPDWFTNSVFREEGTGRSKRYYVLASSYTLDKIVDDYAWKWSDTEDKWANEDWQLTDWYMREVIFKMTRRCSPFERNVYDLKSDKIEWYGRCPYIEIDGVVYFPLSGFWADSKAAVKKGRYGFILREPQPDASITLPKTFDTSVGLNKPFVEIYPETK